MSIRHALDKVGGLRSTMRVLPPGAELYRQGEKCGTYFIVASGWIALSTLVDDGGCQILDFAVPGAFLGFPFLSNMARCHSARCITAVRVFCYPEPQLDHVLVQNAKLAILLCRQIVLDEWRAHNHLVNLGLRSARERIAHLLLELYIRLRGRTPNKGDVIRIPLTQGHIGQAVGLTGVHVSRTLRTLREQGIAQFVKQDLEILDPNALVRTAGFPDLVPETTLTLDRLHAPNSERFAALSEAATLAYQ